MKLSIYFLERDYYTLKETKRLLEEYIKILYFKK